MSAHMYLANYVEPAEEEGHPFIGLLTSGKYIGGEVRYKEDDVLSAVDEYMAVAEERYRRLMQIAIEAGIRIGHQGDMPVRLPDNWPRSK